MALTPSNSIAVGTHAPGFELPDTVSGKNLKLQQLAAGKPTLIMFICNHCPYVVHLLPELQRLAADYRERISFVGISSNDVANYPQDGPEHMQALAQRLGFGFPYLYDETQQVAKAYSAACTPDFYLFDQNLRLAYHGRLDGSSPGNDVPQTSADMRAALEAVLAGQSVPGEQLPSVGCNIKWKV